MNDSGILRTLVQVDTLLVLKMMLVGNYTTFLRFKHRVFATAEDYEMRNMAVREPNAEIERTRRAHLNDLENVLPFFVVSGCCALTDPNPTWFSILMWSYLALRSLYSIFYVRGMQPHRTIAFTFAAIVTGTMMVLTLLPAFTR